MMDVVFVCILIDSDSACLVWVTVRDGTNRIMTCEGSKHESFIDDCMSSF